MEFEQEKGSAGREAAGDVAQERLLRAVVREEVHDVEAGRGVEAVFVEVGDVSVDETDAVSDAGLPRPVPGDVDHLARRIDAGQPPAGLRRLEGDQLDAGSGPDDQHPRTRAPASLQASLQASLEERERLPERAQVAGYYGAGDVLVVAAVRAVEVEWGLVEWGLVEWGLVAGCTHGHKKPAARDSFKCDVAARQA